MKAIESRQSFATECFWICRCLLNYAQSIPNAIQASPVKSEAATSVADEMD